MRPPFPPPPVVRVRHLPQYRLPGCRKWRRTLREACRDYAFLSWMAAYNCDEGFDYVPEAPDYDRPFPHRCTEECWGEGRRHAYMQRVVDRYARLLERKMKETLR